MYEIELKAHVKDRKKTLSALNSFACPIKSQEGIPLAIEKDDTYYRLPLTGRAAVDGRPYLTCRIRREVCRAIGKETEKGCTVESNTVFFTYKRKALKHEGGCDIEVNDEKECRLDDDKALISMLLDAGFFVSQRKRKTVLGYTYPTPLGEAHIELCTVPPLGDFLEIEIMSEENDDKTVYKAQEAIKKIFQKCSISLDAIEERYYSQMLQDNGE